MRGCTVVAGVGWWVGLGQTASYYRILHENRMSLYIFGRRILKQSLDKALYGIKNYPDLDQSNVICLGVWMMSDLLQY